MFAGGCPGDGRWRKVSRGVEDAVPCGLPGNGRQREPAPHPALRGHLPPRGKARVVVGGSGRPRWGGGTPPYGWGYGNARGVYADTRSRAAARLGPGMPGPGGLRGHPSMVRSVGRGLDPSAGDCPGDGCWRKVSRGVVDAAPYGLPGNGRLPRLTPPTSPPAYSRCCRRQNRWGRSGHRPDARFRRWIRSRRASGHRRSGPEGTGVCRRCNFSSAG